MPISKIGSKALVDCSVAAVDIADNSITSAKLAGSIANAKLANSSVTINGSSVSLGSSLTLNALNWQTVKTSGFTAIAGEGYFCNTTSAAFTVTLPASATRGDTIALKDYAGTFATYNLTIARNGHNIQGVANNSLISTNRASLVLVYVDNTRGWEFVTESNVAELVPAYISATGGTILTDGNFKTHVFTGDGSFVVSCAGNSAGSNSVEYLVVAGGGGGGGRFGGGGGAGGYRQNYPSPTTTGLSITATTFPITVGGGGAAGVNTSPKGVSGNPSIFSTITSAGGGGGAGGGEGGCAHKGVPGGSGGAPTSTGCGSTHVAGTGNTPPVSPPQGNPSGFGGPSTLQLNAAGGGGAGASGTPSDGPNNGFGGVGSPIATTFFGPTSPSYGTPGPAPGRYFAGGGAGNSPSIAGGTGGGSGGGGNSSPRSPNTTPGVSGTTNTGGGGGGGGPATPGTNGGTGGKGIVIIRYKYQ
jgi:hypothetical protein